ncbi:hypothetical protein IM538_03150 [Cytobacillus suaedae]|nr:hypothetical protein IM538_03150 [Cytobacillus suaedae]
MFPQRYPQHSRRMGRPGIGPMPNQLIGRRNNFQAPIRRPLRPVPPAQIQPNNMLSMFKGEDGSWDFNKISNTASQAMGVYKQFSGMAPMLLKLFKG